MSTIVPEVSGLGIAVNTVRLHLFPDAYARSIGKGEGKVAVHYSEMERPMLEKTLASGYFCPIPTRRSCARRSTHR
jgi:hypothetical protein